MFAMTATFLPALLIVLAPNIVALVKVVMEPVFSEYISIPGEDDGRKELQVTLPPDGRAHGAL